MGKFKRNWHTRTLAFTGALIIAICGLFSVGLTGSTAVVSASSVSTSASVVADTDVSNCANFSTDVIYQIMTDRFYDGNPSNNPSGSIYDKSDLRKYHGGDWAGITQKLNENYFTNMGVTALWISQPVQNVESLDPQWKTAAYFGYWPKDFMKTNEYYGTESELKTLIDTAHSKNIKVIIDFTPNHTSTCGVTGYTYPEDGALYQNGTFLGSWSNDPNGIFNHLSSISATGWDVLEECVYHRLSDLNDLNQMNSTVDTYLKNAIKKWLDCGVDGIRIDAVKHMAFGWQKNWLSSIYSHKGVFTFGEYYVGSSSSETSNQKILGNETGMNLLDFNWNSTVDSVLSGSKTMYDLDNTIASDSSLFNHPNNCVNFIDSHDKSRITTLCGGNTNKVNEAFVLLLTSRGIPNIYYGSEQYSTGASDPDNRADMPSFSQNTTAYKVISKLAPLHKTNPALAYGTTKQRWINNDVYIYERQFGNNVVLTAVNRNQSTSYSISGLYTAMPAGTYSDVLNGMLGGGSITVGSSGAVNSFTLGAGASAVWQYVSNSYSTPVIGSVGPYMGAPGNTVTIDGRAFGERAGSVYFGKTAATIVSWGNTEIKVKVPNTAAGYTGVKVVTSSGVSSSEYSNFEVLTGQQVAVRFKVNNAVTSYGTNVYLVGSCAELGNWDTSKAVGPFFNNTSTIATYPTWFYDVSVPAGTTIEYKFIKKDSSGNVTWESGSNHTITTPSSGTSTVTVDW